MSTSLYSGEHPSTSGDLGLGAHKSLDLSCKSVPTTIPSHDLVVTVDASEREPQIHARGLRFWMCILAVMISSFIIAVDLVGIGTALPIIVSDLHGTEFEWVGSAYALAGTAFLPLSGGLAQVFGRRTVMLLMVFLFAVGSAMCGAAPSMNFLIASRAIQGIGSGGIASLTQIIISDLVPLHERGTFNGLIAIGYGFGTSTAPVISGALAENGQWRWFFYLNLPICAVTGLLIFVFLHLKAPKGTIKEKLLQLDWIGNFLIMGATTAVVIALTWAGIKFPWRSAQVLTPLIVGIAGLFAFVFYESKYSSNPLVPFQVMSNRTSASGYVQAFFTNFYLLGATYYLPTYFEACKAASPLASAVDTLTIGCVTMPFGLVSGITVAKSGKYRPQLWLAWVGLIAANALMMTLHADTNRAKPIGFQVLHGLGLGILMTTVFFPVLAPLPVTLNANALAFFMFLRYFSQVWGVTVGGTVLQNELPKRLPAEFIEKFPEGTSIAYSIIPIISTLDEPFQTKVRVAFADSLRVYWGVLLGVAVVGLLVSLLMKGLPLHTSMDKDWGLEETEKPATEMTTRNA